MKNHSFQKVYSSSATATLNIYGMVSRNIFIRIFILSLLVSLMFTGTVYAVKPHYAVINNRKINLELADTERKREVGLMYRDYMAPDHGMIFIFEKPQEVSFWMKNVNFPLDILFIYKNKVVKIYSRVPGCKSEPCDIYPSIYKVDSVIELNGGYCSLNNIKAGQTVKLDTKLRKLIIN